MKYMGNKRRIVKEIMPLMLAELQPGQCFVDAFCGSCTISENVPKDHRRIANDAHRWLIAMWERLTTTDWKPPTTIDKELYDKVRSSWRADDGRYDDATIGYIGWMASRSGKWFEAGYSGHNVKGRDYIAENIRNTTKQIENLKGVEWHTGSYADLVIPENSLIYCDPPYKNKNKYKQEFDFDKFYNWARFQENIFISEYEMPDDFIEITSFDKRVLMDATAKAGYKKEKLFTNKLTFETIKDNLI